ncbi:type II secretion system F family protein [Vibrio variabilis]|uniref:type II secretion system F family protein n=1 Tax=Vibrio variabilis TaxID=990271 RepID=UPI000DD5C497|nr:type II secretion system F family protein [Vibrio variabilis]
MLSLVAFVVFVGAAVYFVVDSYQRQKRTARIEQYLKEDSYKAPSQVGLFLLRFGTKHRKELENKFLEAGFYNKELAKFYFPMKLLAIAVLVSIAMVSEMEWQSQVLTVMLGLVAVIVVPDAILDVKRKTLISSTSSKLPYLLDMLSVCVQTGMTIEASFDYLSKELDAFDKDLCYQVKRTAESSKIKGLESALNDLSERLPTPEVRSFVLTVIQNLQYGTSIAKVLSDLAEDMRKIQLLTIEEKVGKLSSKMGVPLILFIMFPIVVLILAPAVIQMSANIGG